MRATLTGPGWVTASRVSSSRRLLPPTATGLASPSIVSGPRMPISTTPPSFRSAGDSTPPPHQRPTSSPPDRPSMLLVVGGGTAQRGGAPWDHGSNDRAVWNDCVPMRGRAVRPGVVAMAAVAAACSGDGRVGWLTTHARDGRRSQRPPHRRSPSQRRPPPTTASSRRHGYGAVTDDRSDPAPTPRPVQTIKSAYECPTADPRSGEPVELTFWHVQSGTGGEKIDALAADYDAATRRCASRRCTRTHRWRSSRP